MFPRGDVSLVVERAGEMVIRRRAIKIVLHVVFASPQDHHRFAGDFGDLRRFHHEVGL